MAVKKIFVLDDHRSLRNELKYVKDANKDDPLDQTKVPPLSTRKWQESHPNYYRDKVPIYEFMKDHGS